MTDWPSHTIQSWSPTSRQAEVITAMDHQLADVSAESQLKAPLKEIAGPAGGEARMDVW